MPGEGLRLRYPLLDRNEMDSLADRLRLARDEVLLSLEVEDIAQALGRAGARFLTDGDPLREEALTLLSLNSGLSSAMAEAVLDGMAHDWTHRRLQLLLRSEFGDPRVLDGFRQAVLGGSVRAWGYPLTLHVCAGTVPGVSVMSLLRGFLVKSAVLLKPGRGDAVLPVLFLRALEEESSEIASCAAAVYWPGGEMGSPEAQVMAEAAVEEADLVVAYGGDDTVEGLRRRISPTVPLLAYHHRVSLAVVGREALTPDRVAGVAADGARAVALFDQRGCVSPHVLHVEEGGPVGPGDFATELARAMESVEEELPLGELRAEEASAAQQVRGTAELEASAGGGIEVHSGRGNRWTVIFDTDPSFEASCLSRVVRVKPVPDVLELPALLAPLRSHLQTVAVEGVGERLDELTEMLARVGVVRVTSLQAAPWPPPWWHHDGMGPLRSMVRWVDREV
jgi:cytochrome c551/c552